MRKVDAQLYLLGIALIYFFLLGISSPTRAETNTYRCEVSLVDFNRDVKKKIGSFSTLAKSEKLVTKAFQFPDTDLFITASVLYLPKSPYLEGAAPNEVILTLVIGRKPYSEIETEMKNSEVISNARAIVPLKSIESARVETIFLGKQQPMIVALECTK